MPRFFLVTLVYQVQLNERNVASATKVFLIKVFYIYFIIFSYFIIFQLKFILFQ